MKKNYGKDFENVIKEAFLKVEGVSIDRIPDQTMHHKGATNICDFIVYKRPCEYYIECKTVHGNRLAIFSTDEKHSYGNISNDQWNGMLKKSSIPGVTAGVMCWWVDRDITAFLPIQLLQAVRELGFKSVRFDDSWFNAGGVMQAIIIPGKKKRVFFDYDMHEFFQYIEKQERS